MQKLLFVIKEKGKYISDVVLNVIATAIPLLILQFYVLPKVNSNVGEDYYGLIVTLIGILTFFTSASSISLNNVRLLLDLQYKEEKIEGDFNIIQLVFSTLNAIAVVVVSLFYEMNFNTFQFILLVLAAFIICAEGYYSVGFRLQLNYKRVLVQKIFLSIGYICGYFLFLQTGYWILIYILGYLFDLIYVLVKTELIKESWRITKLFKTTVKNESVLMTASLIGTISTYIDKLIIYPLYGGIITTTYYVSTLMGKGISLATFPISGVLLSYFSKKKKIENNTVKLMIVFGWTAGIVGYIACLFVTKPVLSFLYPDIVEDAMNYVPVTLFISVIDVQNTFMSPVVLRYCKITWQIVISVCTILVYLITSLVLMKIWGLMGFCVGGVITTLFKYIVYLIIYLKDNRNIKK